MLQVLRRRATVAYTGAVVVGLTASCGAGAGEESGAAASSAPSAEGFQTPAVESGFATPPPPDGGGGAGGSGGGSSGERVIAVSGPTL